MNDCPYCQNSFEMTETCSDEFRIWQGLQGPYYIPSVDENGILSWTNTGELPNPDPVDITGPAGSSFSIAGIVETVGDLPSEAEGVWLVGEEAPYEGYSFVDGAWTDIGEFAIGPQGPAGEDGATGQAAGFGTPTATIDNNTGTPGVTITASGPDTAKVFTFAFTNLKGATGATGQTGPAGQGIAPGGSTSQVLAKKSNADYDTEWVNPSGGADPATATPLMDGTAAVGTATKYAREDHVHPTDTSKQDTLVSGTNIKTINSNSILGSGDITITSGVSSVNGATGTVVLDADDVGAMSKWVLLWTNASPGSSFAGQTVQLDLSGYDIVVVLGRVNTTSDNYCSCIAFKGIGNFLGFVTYHSTASKIGRYRWVTPSDSGVVFSNCTYSSGDTDNANAIPYQIYGIKGVQTS